MDINSQGYIHYHNTGTGTQDRNSQPQKQTKIHETGRTDTQDWTDRSTLTNGQIDTDKPTDRH